MAPPYPEPPAELMKIQGSHQFPRRFPHWSSKGVVATYCVEKPHTGPFETLLDCEFDLMYSPLLEAKIGRGRVILCLLDVTERYGREPVPTLLVDRLVDCLLKPHAMARKKGCKYVGSQTGWDTLTLLKSGATREESVQSLLESDLAVVGPDDETLRLLREARATIESFLKRGGTLVVLPLEESAPLDWLPFAVNLKTREVFSTKVPAHAPAFRGLGMSDFWWRQTREMPVLEGLPENAVAADPAILASVPVGRGQVVFCQVVPQMFDDPDVLLDRRQFVKAARVINTLLRNLGVEMPIADWSPVRKGYGKQALPYLCRTLCFDPYEHHYW